MREAGRSLSRTSWEKQPRPPRQADHIPYRNGRKGGNMDRLRATPRARGGSRLAERIQQCGVLHGEGGGRADRKFATGTFVHPHRWAIGGNEGRWTDKKADCRAVRHSPALV